MPKKIYNLFAQLQFFEQEIGRLEEKILNLNQKIDQLVQIERNHLIRVKNQEEVTDEFIRQGRKYQDLSPEKAWKLYSDKDFDFILLDVSHPDYRPERKIPEALRIPFEELHDRFYELSSKTTPIMVISENGTTSILACAFLVQRGYFNCSNISGGYRFWKGTISTEVKSA